MKLSFFEFLAVLLITLIVAAVFIGGLFAAIEWAHTHFQTVKDLTR